MPDYLLGIDQGTSGSRALVLDRQGRMRGYGYRQVERIYPRPDWVEQEPVALADGVRQAIGEALQQAQCRPTDIAACGLASQRDTDFVWDARTGQPLANAITWQDLRTEALEDQLRQWPHAHECRTRLGYWPGPYSGALHLKWRLTHQPAAAEAARAGALRAGASAVWVLHALGHANGHQSDVSLAQSLCLYDFRAGDYWAEWLDYLGLSRAALPQVNPTIADFGALSIDSIHIPVRAMIADQQGALFGYDCRRLGDAECTHGTASFVNVCLGENAPELETLKVYLAWLLDGRPTHCLEAATTVTGAAVRWLKENARLLDRDDELGELAGSVHDAGGLMFVPAFTGPNAPHDFRGARGSLLGLTLGHTRAHIARALLDAIGFQMRDILEEIGTKVGVRVAQLKVGGGLSNSDVACQLQADWLGLPIIRPTFTQTTARAAALLAGIGAAFWTDESDLPPLPGERTVFEPRLNAEQRDAGYAEWKRAIAAVKHWALTG